MSAEITFTDPEVQVCPFSAYHQARAEQPVYRDPVSGVFYVLDYKLTRAAAMDVERLSNQTGQLLVSPGPLAEQIMSIYRTKAIVPVDVLVAGDPPVHTLHRALVDKTFTISRVKQMEDYLNEIVDTIIDRLDLEHEFEFMRDFAIGLPVAVIADQLGIPLEDRPQFKLWSIACVEAVSQNNDAAKHIELANTVADFHKYILDRAQMCLTEPDGSLLSDLVHSEIDGQRLGMAEVVSIVRQMLNAGNETTTSVLGSGMLHLIEEPYLQDELREHPELIPNFVEEVLRLESPLQGMFRRAKVDMELGGVAIPKDSLVFLRWGAANRDPAMFANHDKLDLHRDHVRSHLTFGAGIHFCIGNQLARRELCIAFEKLTRALCNMRLARGEASTVRKPHVFAYGLIELHMRADRVAAVQMA